jgi:hypothetical protein
LGFACSRREAANVSRAVDVIAEVGGVELAGGIEVARCAHILERATRVSLPVVKGLSR